MVEGNAMMNLPHVLECCRRCCCRREKILRYISWGLVAIGAILVICFVPMEFWLVILGIVLILLGVLLIL